VNKFCVCVWLPAYGLLPLYGVPALWRNIVRAAVGMGIPMGMGVGWYGDYDESPWVCGDSIGIFEWIPNYRLNGPN